MIDEHTKAASASSVCEYRLTESERATISMLCRQVSEDPYSRFEFFYDAVRQLQPLVPTRLRHEIETFRGRGNTGALMIRDVPLPALPPTPGTLFVAAPMLDLQTEIPLTLLATMVAEPFSFAEWDGGHLIQNRYAIRSHRQIQMGSNAVELMPHSEMPFREFCPEYIALLCLRADPDSRAFTTVCDLAALVDAMSPTDVSMLAEPLFAFESLTGPFTSNSRRLTAPMPIMSVRQGRRTFHYSHDLTAITPGAQDLLDRLRSAIESSSCGILLEQGSLLLLNNSYMLHGRSEYRPKYNGSDRWLQRMLLTSDVKTWGFPLRQAPDRSLAYYPTQYQRLLLTETAPGGAYE